MIETFETPLPGDIQALATRVMEDVCAREAMIALAESCTGGLVAAVLTDIEGCSHGFDRGFVTYTDEAKRDQLGVPDNILKTEGAVSAPAARAMAEGALSRSRAAFALSVTGFAGPGKPDEEPGLVFLGLARSGEFTVVQEHHFGDVSRAAVRLACLRQGLELIRKGLDGTLG